MTTTGTYTFSPSAADLVLYAFGMVGIRRWELTQQHLVDAGMAANLTMVDFSNRNPNRWQEETVPIALTQGIPTYNLPSRTLAISIAYINTSTGGTIQSRVLGPLSSTDYAALPQKAQQAPPTSFFFNLSTPIPTVTIWPVPDQTGVYTLQCQTFRQSQDVVLPAGVGIDSPYRFLDAFAHQLAGRLAISYPPKTQGALSANDLQALADAKFTLAAQRDQESTPMYVRPQFGGYYRI